MSKSRALMGLEPDRCGIPRCGLFILLLVSACSSGTKERVDTTSSSNAPGVTTDSSGGGDSAGESLAEPDVDASYAAGAASEPEPAKPLAAEPSLEPATTPVEDAAPVESAVSMPPEQWVELIFVTDEQHCFPGNNEPGGAPTILFIDNTGAEYFQFPPVQAMQATGYGASLGGVIRSDWNGTYYATECDADDGCPAQAQGNVSVRYCAFRGMLDDPESEFPTCVFEGSEPDCVEVPFEFPQQEPVLVELFDAAGATELYDCEDHHCVRDVESCITPGYYGNEGSGFCTAYRQDCEGCACYPIGEPGPFGSENIVTGCQELPEGGIRVEAEPVR